MMIICVVIQSVSEEKKKNEAEQRILVLITYI